MMRNAQRLERLEQAEGERRVLRDAERLAERYGVGVDDVLREAGEIGQRVARWGVDAEVRRMAAEWGVSEDDVWARYSVAVADLETA
jgi:hypothetical protein